MGKGGILGLAGEFTLCSNEALSAGLMKVSLKFACNTQHNGEFDVPPNAGSSSSLTGSQCQVPSLRATL